MNAEAIDIYAVDYGNGHRSYSFAGGEGYRRIGRVWAPLGSAVRGERLHVPHYVDRDATHTAREVHDRAVKGQDHFRWEGDES